ncbi:glycoside hydrolase family 88 protein [Termitidicoccus mucosus]|uniref:Glycosyl hydrolase family 88 n=1 Tax=Termitidicoccus mucosus TaxID=1184151 RepID=A0A178IM61_9BACT|nr:hypothetical protein AW736_05610 [Opitutaceae bacterium TSB47]
MKNTTPSNHIKFAAMLALAASSVTALLADGPFRNRDNPAPYDISEGGYPVPYQMPQKAEIIDLLVRVRDYLDQACVTRVIDTRTGDQILDKNTIIKTAVMERGEAGSHSVFDYTMGVTHSGMLQCAEVTGDKKFRDFTARHMAFIHDWLPYFKAQHDKFGKPVLIKQNGFRNIIEPDSLDSCGAMCAALIKARMAGVDSDLKEVIDRWSHYISKEQMRLKDGTLARKRPQPESLWSDDFYMSIPALAQMGRMTGDKSWYDDAAKQVVQMSRRLFNENTGLYAHGWNSNQPDNPCFYWSRANGWVMMATIELLDVLPETHPQRDAILDYLRKHIYAIATLQSGTGMWHQMLDKAETFEETSGTAMFVYSIYRAINKGWISPVTYGSIAQAGWIGLSQKVNRRGQLEDTCVGTTFASDNVYYYNRPRSPYATHAYGAFLLAGSEMIRAMENPTIDIQYKTRTYHYVPKKK